jgi:heme/copper-type cytochrome/quinol oxidase subunit 2
MDILLLFFYIILFLIAIAISIASIKYFITMYKFKNRKKDGSEDKDFKYFD